MFILCNETSKGHLKVEVYAESVVSGEVGRLPDQITTVLGVFRQHLSGRVTRDLAVKPSWKTNLFACFTTYKL